LPQIKNAMEKHAGDASVQEYACAALGNLANNPENKVTITNFPGVLKVVRAALDAHRNDFEMAVECKKCLELFGHADTSAPGTCLEASKSLAYNVFVTSGIPAAHGFSEVAMHALKGDAEGRGSFEYGAVVTAIMSLMKPPVVKGNIISPIPILWSGFDALYGSSHYVLLELARKLGGYMLFHNTDAASKSTVFGELMVRSGVTKKCRLLGKERGELATAIWNTASRRFVQSFESNTVAIALNCPPQFFHYTIMYKKELGALAEKNPSVTIDVYVVTALPKLPSENVRADLLNKNRGPQKDGQALCKGYTKYFAEFNFTGKITCRDCPSDDLASCHDSVAAANLVDIKQ